jgi:hypothetical protein
MLKPHKPLVPYPDKIYIRKRSYRDYKQYIRWIYRTEINTLRYKMSIGKYN